MISGARQDKMDVWKIDVTFEEAEVTGSLDQLDEAFVVRDVWIGNTTEMREAIEESYRLLEDLETAAEDERKRNLSEFAEYLQTKHQFTKSRGMLHDLFIPPAHHTFSLCVPNKKECELSDHD
jgi:hypothetical protein